MTRLYSLCQRMAFGNTGSGSKRNFRKERPRPGFSVERQAVLNA